MIAAEAILTKNHFVGQVYLFDKKTQPELEQHENDWVQSVRSGDTAAFESIFKNLYKPLCAYAMVMMKDKDSSEEIVQQVFVKIWERRASLNVSSSLKAYLYQIVRNDCLNALKHEKIKEQYRQHKVIEMQQHHENASHRLTSRELEQQIQNAIDELPEQCGIIFRMSRFEELKYKDIAEQLSISVKTVENQMGKALKLMRLKLADYITITLTFIFLNF